MTVRLIHGFNVSDDGRGSVGRLTPHLERSGRRVIVHSYGWVGLFRLRWRNVEATAKILPHIRPGDVLVGHSNGCLICWELVEAGAPVAAVICIQPALRRDTRWPEGLPVLCLHNDDDWIVSLGRAWGRFISVANPLKGRHGWGAAGRYGFTLGQPNVDNWNTGCEPIAARGHSGIFKPAPLAHWGPLLRTWVDRRLAKRSAA